MALPQVSIVLPVRDGAAYLAAAMDSLIGQSFADFEILAVDDGSRDATPEILAGYAAADRRVRVLAPESRGLANALNFGLAEARGDLVARMDADDIARPGRLAAEVGFLADHPQVAVVGTQIETFDAAGARKRSSFPCAPDAVRAGLQRLCCLAHPSVLMRRASVLAVGGYRCQFRYTEDYDLWLRILERADIANLACVGLDYRQHAGMSTVRAAAPQALEAAAVRALARLRQRGEAEPTLEPLPVTADTLAGLGISRREIAAITRRAWFKAARALNRAGVRKGARECRSKAGPLVLPDGGPGDIADYALRWLKTFA